MKCIKVDYKDFKSLSLFKKFYYEVLEIDFSEEQRETLEELLDTLKKQEEGFFDKSSYNILILIDELENILGGIIFDYFHNTNSGLIEYIVTNRKYRRKGIASQAYSLAIELLKKEANKNGYDSIDFVFVELEKTEKEKKPSRFFWKKKGFKKIKFDYIQPALSKNKEEFRNMDFGIILSEKSKHKNYILAKDLKSILFDYAYYTMRINKPNENPSIIEMYSQINELSYHTGKIDIII